MQRPVERHRRGKGFTLIELMVVMAILAIFVVVALPGFSALRLSTNLKSYSSELAASVLMARSEAIKRNIPMRLCSTSDGAICATSSDWEQGWLVLDPNDVVIKRQQSMPDGFKLTSTSDGSTVMTTALTFQPSGVSSTVAVMIVCRLTPTVGNHQRLVTVTATGRPRITKAAASTCP